jgi:hypothetical protein
MSTLFVSNARPTEVQLDPTIYETLHVTQSGSITTTNSAVTGGDQGLEVVVDGSIRSQLDAIAFSGIGCAITVGSTGTVRGTLNGISLGDDANVVINNGQVSASPILNDTAAIWLDGSDNHILNSGILSGFYGIRGSASQGNGNLNHIVNTGQIEAGDTGILLNAESGLVPSAAMSPEIPYGVFNSGTILAGVAGVVVELSGNVTNSGLIQAGSFGVTFASGDSFLSNTGTIVAQTAVFGSYDRDILLNQGTIQGDILLSEGDDLYDGRTGTVTDIVNLGKGDDVGHGGGGVETFIGGDGKDSLFGHGGDDSLVGGFGIDYLDGGEGADLMVGGEGDDSYVIDDANDVAMEASGGFEGTDLVRASISYALGTNLENLWLTGSANLNGTGNALANRITGNAGSNLLDGGVGADNLAGGAGNDTYMVDDRNDVVTEATDEGTDTVSASVSYALGAHVENLVLTGSGNISGIGNERANQITGNAGSNLLDGGAGADRLAGGLGNDTYIVDDASDSVTEGLDEGTDAVRASISYALADNVENLVLTGAGDSNGTGNNLANIIAGNGGSNRLEGGGGADQLDGGSEQDTALFSGLLSDYTITRSPDGTLTIIDNTAGRDGTDTLTNIEFLQFQDGTITVPTRAPVAPAVQGSVNPINENAAPFTPVASVLSPGLAAGSVAYSIASNPGSKFVIDPTSGVISLVGAVDYESTEDPDLQTEMVGTLVRKFYVLSVKATESLTGWSSAATQVKVYVSDVNEAATGFSFTDGTTKAAIGESAADGALIGALQASDPEGDAGLLYAFDTTGANGTSGAGNAGGRFKIENGR